MIFFFVCFYIFIGLQGDLRSNWAKVVFYFILDFNLFYVLSIKDNNFFSIIIHYLILFIFLLLVQFHLFVIISFIFFFKHIFHKIILNIYFDHIHIMCLYKIFSVHCMSYMLVTIIKVKDKLQVRHPIIESFKSLGLVHVWQRIVVTNFQIPC